MVLVLLSCAVLLLPFFLARIVIIGVYCFS